MYTFKGWKVTYIRKDHQYSKVLSYNHDVYMMFTHICFYCCTVGVQPGGETPYMKVVQMSGWPNFWGTRLYGKYSLKFRPGYRENILESAYFDIQFHKIVLNFHIYFSFI